MLDNFVVLVGIVMSLGHWPQIFKVIKNKSADDLSMITYSVIFSGQVIWLIYGLDIGNIPIIVNNAVSLVGISVLIYLKMFKYGKIRV